MKKEHFDVIDKHMVTFFRKELGGTTLSARFTKHLLKIDSALKTLSESQKTEDAINLLKATYTAYDLAKGVNVYNTLFESLHQYLLLVLTSDFSTYKDGIVEYKEKVQSDWAAAKKAAETPCPTAAIGTNSLSLEKQKEEATWKKNTTEAKKLQREIEEIHSACHLESVSITAQELFEGTIKEFKQNEERKSVGFFETSQRTAAATKEINQEEKYFTDDTVPQIHTEKILVLQKIMIEALQKKGSTSRTINQLNDAFGKLIAAECQHLAETNEEIINAWDKLVIVLNNAHLVFLTPIVFEISRNPNLDQPEKTIIEQENPPRKKRKQETMISEQEPSWEEKVLRLIVDASDASTQQASSSTQASNTQIYATVFSKQRTPTNTLKSMVQKNK